MTKRKLKTMAAFAIIVAIIIVLFAGIYASPAPLHPLGDVPREEYNDLKIELEKFKDDLDSLLEGIESLKHVSAETPTIIHTEDKTESSPTDTTASDTTASYHPILYFIHHDNVDGSSNGGQGGPTETPKPSTPEPTPSPTPTPNEPNEPNEPAGVPEFGFDASIITSLATALYLVLKRRHSK